MVLSNVLKFTATGYVEVRAELLGRKDGGDTERFSVKDTGIGMEPEVQQHLPDRSSRRARSPRACIWWNRPWVVDQPRAGGDDGMGSAVYAPR
jgi:hypothetical protein